MSGCYITLAYVFQMGKVQKHAVANTVKLLTHVKAKGFKVPWEK